MMSNIELHGKKNTADRPFRKSEKGLNANVEVGIRSRDDDVNPMLMTI